MTITSSRGWGANERQTIKLQDFRLTETLGKAQRGADKIAEMKQQIESMQMTFDIDRRDLNRRLHLQEEENIKAAAVRDELHNTAATELKAALDAQRTRAEKAEHAHDMAAGANTDLTMRLAKGVRAFDAWNPRPAPHCTQVGWS